MTTLRSLTVLCFAALLFSTTDANGQAKSKAKPKPAVTPINPDERFPFRTDTANGHLPWYEPRDDEFPPAGASHAISGELIQVEPWLRHGILRPDRTNDQSRAFIDLPLAFSLLPYGSVWHLGAPAALRDMPIGTHLHGEFFWNSTSENDPKLKTLTSDRRIATFFPFDRMLRLEDDFSRSVRPGIF